MTNSYLHYLNITCAKCGHYVTCVIDASKPNRTITCWQCSFDNKVKETTRLLLLNQTTAGQQ